MRRRSASCAASTRCMLTRRSLSSRSSVELNVEMTAATSAVAVGSRRLPGSSTSTTDMSSDSRRRGRRLNRTSQALAKSITRSPVARTSELAAGRSGVDRHRRDDEERHRRREDRGVHREHAPVQADPQSCRAEPFECRAAIVPAAVQRCHLHPRATMEFRRAAVGWNCVWAAASGAAIIRSRAHVAGCRARVRQIDRADAPETARSARRACGHGGGGAARAAAGPRSAPGVRGGGRRGRDRRRVGGVGLRARPRRPLRGRADRGGVSLRAPVRRGEPRGRRAGRSARVGPQAPQPRRRPAEPTSSSTARRAARRPSGARPRPCFAASASTAMSSSGSRPRSSAVHATRGRSSRWSGCSRCRLRRPFPGRTTRRSSATGFTGSRASWRRVHDNALEGGRPVEVRQAAMIVATTCLVTFGVVLAALLMVRG